MGLNDGNNQQTGATWAHESLAQVILARKKNAVANQPYL